MMNAEMSRRAKRIGIVCRRAQCNALFLTMRSDENNKTPAEAGVPVGLTRIELVTSSLSGMRSNRLSYSEVLLSVTSE